MPLLPRWVGMIAVVALVPGGAWGDPVVVGPELRTAVGLTVYSQENLALVREVRRATLPAGDVTLRFPGVPRQIDPRTVALRAVDDAHMIRVYDQSVRDDLASPERLLARWIGKTVELVETDEQLATKVTDADLLSLGPPPVYRVGDRLLVGHPGRVQLPPADVEVMLEPTISWRIACKDAGPRDLEAAYATSGLGWEADYTLRLAANAFPTTARLEGWITLRNDTDGMFERTTLALIAGRVHRVAPPVAKTFAMRAEAMVADAAPPAEAPVLDYHRYAVADLVTLAPHETKQLHLLAAPEVRVTRRYRVTTGGLWHGATGTEDEQRLPVEIRLAFRNDRASGLGTALPAGIVRVEAPASDGTLEFVGEDRIGHVATDEPVDLRIGEASDLVALRRQTDYRQTGTKPYVAEIAVTTTLRNRTAAIDVREPLAGSWKVLESTHAAERVNAGLLGFTVEVPAGGDVELRYRVQLGP
jgi:hypothetical protein